MVVKRVNKVLSFLVQVRHDGIMAAQKIWWRGKLVKTRIIGVLVVLCSTFMSLHAFGITEKAKDALIERITPIGSVCEEGDPKCAAVVNTGEPRAGDVVYESACVSCHGLGVAGAPKVGDKGAWASRIGAGKASLYNNALNGVGAMPAKGACATCSDDEIKAAVDYMVGKSK